MAAKEAPIHLRSPQRADAIGGAGQKPGEAPPIVAALDPRTVSQDTVLKTN